MKAIIFVSFIVLTTIPLLYPQTQLLRVGNAAQYSYESNTEWIVLTTKSILINGKEYFERKTYTPWIIPSSDLTTYERIEGDSVHYVLDSMNQDSLLFNFNWQLGTKYLITKLGNVVSGQRIDSIKFINTFLPDDTVYVLRNFIYNISTGDTSYNVLPEYNYLSKKCGRLNEGLWIYSTGVKIDGIRYGSVNPYPEEVVFSVDSLYSEFIGDTVNCYIKNTSDFSVTMDSIYTYRMFGYLMYLVKGNESFFINLFNQYPNHPLDTLNYNIPPHDSIQLQIYDVDLCPVCDYEIQDYFQDTLRFVFSFSEGMDYVFDKTIPISGEGHMSDVGDEVVLPAEFILYQNYPNPFNSTSVIKYSIPKSSQVTLKIFNTLGEEIAILVNEEKPVGTYELNWKAANLPSGVYFYQLRAGDFVQTRKMILLK